MKLPGYITKRVRALLEKVMRQYPMSSEEEREAITLLPYFRGRRPPTKKLAIHLRSRKPAKSKLHKENTRALRAAVMERADGKCELCGWRPWNPFALDMHHLLGGSGRRREKQAISNCLAVCRDCHRDHHDGSGPERYVAAVQCWAKAHGYPVPTSILKGPARSAT